MAVLLVVLLAGCGGSPNAGWDPPTEAPPAEQAPLAEAPTPVAAPAGEPVVELYMTSWCPVCRRARGWLQQEGVAFVEHDVEQDTRAQRVMRSVNPRGAVPMFDVDGRILIGFSPPMLRAAIERAQIERTQSESTQASPATAP